MQRPGDLSHHQTYVLSGHVYFVLTEFFRFVFIMYRSLIPAKRFSIVIVSIFTVLLIWILINSFPVDRGILPRIYQIAPSNALSSANISDHQQSWSRFAYTQYATTSEYLCNSVMLFEVLHRFGSKADRLLMYPSSFHLQEGADQSVESRLLQKARDHYSVKIKPVEIQHVNSVDSKPGLVW